MTAVVTSVKDLGNDVLAVEGVADGKTKVAAQGWVSATTNHYDPASYDAAGQRKKGAAPRKMTPGEILEYARRLLDGVVIQEAPAAKDLGIRDAGADAALEALAAAAEVEAAR